MLLSGTLKTIDDEWPCRLINASAAGVRVRSDSPLAVGDLVSLLIADHPSFPAAVVWRSGKEIGLAFIDGPFGGLRRWGERARLMGLL